MPPALSPVDEKKDDVLHVEDVGPISEGRRETLVDPHSKAGLALINQQEAIPTTGKRMPTSRWEYIFFCIFCKCQKPHLCACR